MRATWTLALLPLRQAWVAALLLLLMLVGGVVLALAGGALYGGAMLAALALWFAWLLAGTALKGLARKETLLLPEFHRALAGAAALWSLLFWLLPCALLAPHFGIRIGWVALGAGALAIAWALLTTSGSRSGFLIWVFIIGARFVPEPLLLAIEPALQNPLLPLAALLLAALILHITWQRLFPAGDPPLPDSPLLAPEPMRRGMGNTTSNVPRGKLMQRLNGWSEVGASALLLRQAARYHAAPTPTRQRAMLRALLLPQEQPRGWLVRWLLWGAAIAVYAIAVGQQAQIGMVAGYATFFALTGLNVVGLGMPRLQPSLVELYFSLAPATLAGFKAQLVDSFLGLLPGAILSAFVFTTLAALLIAPPALPGVALTTAILAPPLALATLALYLGLPVNVILRSVVTLITLFGQMGTIWLGYALIDRYGALWGGVPVLVVTWSFAIGAWSAARAHWINNPLSFDPPKAKAGA